MSPILFPTFIFQNYMGHNTQQHLTNDVRTLSEPNVMSNATNRWKGPCHLQYDSHDARLRSFITWPR